VTLFEILKLLDTNWNCPSFSFLP